MKFVLDSNVYDLLVATPDIQTKITRACETMARLGTGRPALTRTGHSLTGVSVPRPNLGARHAAMPLQRESMR